MRYRPSRLFLYLPLFVMILVSACSPTNTRYSNTPTLDPPENQNRQSSVVTVDAHRATPEQPNDMAQLLYSDDDSVRARVGNNPDRQLYLLMAQGDVQWSVLDENNRPLPLERARSGRDNAVNLVGRTGRRYVLEFSNLSDRAYEVVATVDGLDVMTEQPGSISYTGYVLYPRKQLRIEGFRKSDSEIITFRFSATHRAYVANTPINNQPNLGVIGAALFRLEMADSQPTPAPRGNKTPPQPNPFPADRTRPAPDYHNR
jgi:hypothetical protein